MYFNILKEIRRKQYINDFNIILIRLIKLIL